MALEKEIRQENGVMTNYHRILSLDSVINHHISIVVLSYTDAEARAWELEGNNAYKTGITYEKEYEENMTIEDAYSYIKSLPEFEGAEDV